MTTTTTRRKRTLEELHAEAQYIFNKGKVTAAQRRFTRPQAQRMVKLFFAIRKLGGEVTPLLRMGFTPGALYTWVHQFAGPRQIKRVKEYTPRKKSIALRAELPVNLTYNEVLRKSKKSQLALKFPEDVAATPFEVEEPTFAAEPITPTPAPAPRAGLVRRLLNRIGL